MAAQASAPISARARAATSSGSTDFVVWETRVMLTPLLRRWHRSSPGCRWTTHGTGALHLAANAEPRNPGHFVRWTVVLPIPLAGTLAQPDLADCVQHGLPLRDQNIDLPQLRNDLFRLVLPLQSSLMSKTYLKSDHNGGGSIVTTL